MPLLDDRLRERVARAERAVAFTGAGVSAESGLATFRGGGQDALWGRFRPEEVATPEAFRRHPERVWRWYGERFRQARAAEPNPAHRALARFSALFPFPLVVTQNVDGLHQRAGGGEVVELHGTLAAARCDACGETIEMETALARSPDRPPACRCGGLFRPAVVWFGERLPEAAFERAVEEASRCDLFLVAGTSATVFPAAGLIDVAAAAGAAVIEINPEATAFSARADLSLRRTAGEALPALLAEMEEVRRRS
ncbi:MAG TPA: NAD-dependent deacylase [Thermoanaerobaculia bacterium]|nr:NAD-dependent deacylase [Thermoanaerobaculia bacterium]